MSYIVLINTQISSNKDEIFALKKGLPLPKFEKQTVITNITLPLKAKPELTSNIIYWIPTETEINAIDYVSNDWVTVYTTGYSGYVLGSYFDSFPGISNQIKKFKNYNDDARILPILPYKPSIISTESKIVDSDKTTQPSNYINSTSGYGSSHNIITGRRGGRYYINSNGNKTYIKRK